MWFESDRNDSLMHGRECHPANEIVPSDPQCILTKFVFSLSEASIVFCPMSIRSNADGFDLSKFASIKVVDSFQQLSSTPFADGINALCWPRVLDGDFVEVLEKIGPDDGITTLDENMLESLSISPSGRMAINNMLADKHLLSSLGLDPVLNCIHAYPSDDADAPISTDVFSFHVDSAPIQSETWLCTYLGASSEGLLNSLAVRRVDIPSTRAELLELYGGYDDEGFCEFLSENCYDLHYAALADSEPYPFGIANLWRIAVQYPGCPVPPCIHRAPRTDSPRLLLIS